MNNIPSFLQQYLFEIAERLQSGHAAVMIGAGFSKNAIKSNPLCNDFPDWKHLGNAFYKKLYGKQPATDEHYINVLKLADELEAKYGRTVLNKLLKEQIPDGDFEPSELHIKLLELPWTDVFTTNYDTLLERAREKVTSQKFDVVVNKEDLVYSKKPRIVKLHGSFPSERPFIISEEDYRTYPKKFAPYVNTVQQALLENVLCLIGFSGDDPNFLQWIGWIHDNLGKEHASKIYLIGLFNLSDAQKKLLEKRNIILIDLSECYGNKIDYGEALSNFLEFLVSAIKAENRLDWAEKQNQIFPNHNIDILNQLKNILINWKKFREEYPNWIILPEDQRNSLWLYTEQWLLLNRINELGTPFDFDFLYEFNWRIEKSLIPIFNDMIEIYEKMLERYNPFPDMCNTDDSIRPIVEKYKNLNWRDISPKWLELNISILRYYREEGLVEKWEKINSRLEKCWTYLSPLLIARLMYERCMFYIFNFNIVEVRNQSNRWPVNDSLPFWEAKRAGILAEIGDTNEAEKILEKALSVIRKKLNLSPISNDFKLISEEAHVMQLLQYINDAIAFQAGDFEKRQQLREKLGQHWNYLKQFKCDPWYELKIFEISLEKESKQIELTEQKHEFDIGRISVIRHSGVSNKDVLMAYSFLRYCEEAGIPFRIPGISFGKSAAKGAIKRISKYSSYWAFASLIRMGDTNVISSLFNRESIYRMELEQIDQLISNYLSIIKQVWSEIETGAVFKNENMGLIIARMIPEILARLCVKCSDDVRFNLLSFLREIYESEQKFKFSGIDKLMKRLITSYSNQILYAQLPYLLSFPILYELPHRFEFEFPDPFEHLSIQIEQLRQNEKLEINDEIIDNLIQNCKLTNDKRKKSILRLVKLYRLKLLNSKQCKNFADVLWNNVDQKTGLPTNTGLYNFSFLNLPHPQKVDPGYLFKEYLLEGKFPVQGSGKGIPIHGGHFPFFDELLSGTKTISNNNGIEWNENDAITFLLKLINWWDTDKHHLKQKERHQIFISIPDEFRNRFKYLVRILSDVVCPNLTSELSKKYLSELLRLTKELNEYGIPTLKTEITHLHLVPESKDELLSEIQDAISSEDQSEIVDALNAILSAILSPNRSFYSEDQIYDLLSLVTQQIKWRRKVSIASSLNVISNIVEKSPNYLSNKILSDVSIGLKYLLDENIQKKDENGTDIDFRLIYRKNAAHLAYKLYVHYKKNKIKVPKIIRDWEIVCNDPDEFAEIRNEWID